MYYNRCKDEVLKTKEVNNMKEFLLITALLLPIVLGLDIGLCNVVIAVAIWITTIIKYLCDKEL